MKEASMILAVVTLAALGVLVAIDEAPTPVRVRRKRPDELE